MVQLVYPDQAIYDLSLSMWILVIMLVILGIFSLILIQIARKKKGEHAADINRRDPGQGTAQDLKKRSLKDLEMMRNHIK